MDRNELNLKTEELKTAMHNRDFEKAVEIADALDLRKIKDNNFLSLVADAYELAHRYIDAEKVLLIAYENTNAGRHLAYRLCLIAIKNKKYDEAREFYEDFVEMAPRDTARYILKYKMAKAEGSSIDKLIAILEEYVNIDMEEKWAYELAKLYHMAGDEEQCVDMCDEISLWFSEGKYVFKALELKKMHRELTTVQTQKYEESKQKTLEAAEATQAEEIEEPALIEEFKESTPFKETFEDNSVEEITVKPLGEEKFNTMDIQAVIADGMKEVDLQEEVNIHEGEDATKKASDFVAKNFKESSEMEEITTEFSQAEETAERDKEQESLVEEITSLVCDEEKSKPDKKENLDITEPEQIKDIQGVEDILRQLQERGILKSETVEQAVSIIDEAGGSETITILEEAAASETSENEKEAENSKTAVTVEEAAASEEAVTSEETEASEEAVTSEETEASENLVTSEKTEVSENLVISEETEISEGSVISEEIENDDVVESTEESVPEETLEEIKEDAVAYDTVDIVVPENIVDKTGKIPTVPVLDLNFETPKPEVKEPAAELHSSKNLSAKVEIISGTDWKQPESDEVKNTEAESDYINVDNHISEDIEVQTKVTLTEEDLAAFKNYLNVEDFDNNVKNILSELISNYNPNGKSEEGNVVIMGDKKTGKTTLAIEVIKLVNQKRGRRGRRLAKVDAKVLNRRGFKKSLSKLLGSDLVIENAQNLSSEILSELADVADVFTDDMIIILEGDRAGITNMLKESPNIEKAFSNIIKVKDYDVKEWVKYGTQYAKTQGYSIDELGNLAFHKAIDDFFGINNGISQKDVEEIVDRAIAKSGRLGRKLSGIFSSNKDEDGLLTLMESDFNV